MAIEPTVLADGRLSDSEAPLYAVPYGYVAYIKTIALSNLGAGSNITALYIRHNDGNSRRIYREDLGADETERVTDPIVLAYGDTLRGEAANANQVDYAVFGAEEPAGAAPEQRYLIGEIQSPQIEAAALELVITESAVEAV